MVDAFSRANVLLSPQEIVSVQVSGLAPGKEIDLGLNPPAGAALELGGVSLQFNGVRAPILAVRRDEVICVTPAALRGQSLAAVQVMYGAARSNLLYVDVADRNLAFFDQVYNQDGSLNSPDNPARAGSLVFFFFTGAGLPDPPLPDGSIVTSNPPAISLPLELEFRLLGGPWPRVPVPEVIAVPGFVAGLYCARVRIPAATGTFLVYLLYPSSGMPLSYPPVFASISISLRAD